MDAQQSLGTDAILDILSAEIRREIIRSLHETDEVQFEQLSAEIAENIGEDHGEVQIVLNHAHLPMLDSWDIIDYSNGEPIGRGTVFPEVQRYFEAIQKV